MDAQHETIARDCLEAAHRGTMAFPDIVARLIDAGFDGYLVDYRLGRTTYYLASGASLALDNLSAAGAVAAAFDADGVAAQVRWAQANRPDYSYGAFSRNVTACGCAGYLVSFCGRRVLYFGRTGETHTVHFPS
jgi:hypothetical protein